jgi:hypothetical protein
MSNYNVSRVVISSYDLADLAYLSNATTQPLMLTLMDNQTYNYSEVRRLCHGVKATMNQLVSGSGESTLISYSSFVAAMHG